MAKAGKWLEDLVAVIEEALLPSGFTVNKNEKVFNEDGVQISEFDIQVEGFLGSAHIKWLIECRDRPSKGTAPKDWIEQLATRKSVNGFNKVTAVSATGFSPGAIAVAEMTGVELRTVDEMSGDSLLDWFSDKTFTLSTRNGDLKVAQIVVQAKEETDALRQFLSAMPHDQKILTHTGTGERFTVMEAWREIINQQNTAIFDGVTPSNPVIGRGVVVNYTNPDSRYQIEVEGISYPILQIKYVADLTEVVEDIQIETILEYSRALEEEAISQAVKFREFKLGYETLQVSVHRVQEGGKTFLTIERKDV